MPLLFRGMTPLCRCGCVRWAPTCHRGWVYSHRLTHMLVSCYGFTPSPQLSRNSSLSSASPPRVSPLPQHPQTSPQGTVLSTLQHLGGSEDPSSPESSGFLEDESIKDRNGRDLTEQKILRSSGKNTQKNCTKKILMTQITMLM